MQERGWLAAGQLAVKVHYLRENCTLGLVRMHSNVTARASLQKRDDES